MLQHFQARKPSTNSDTKEKVVSATKKALLAITQPLEPHTAAEPEPKPTAPEPVPAAKSPPPPPPASPPGSKALPKCVQPLPLPANYQALGKVFDAIEAVYYFRDSRQEVFIFDAAKKAIENTCRMTINRDTLGQIRSVYPEAFDFQAVPFHEKESKLQSSILLTTKHTLPSDGRHPMLLRKEEFQRRLQGRVIAEHSKFLATLPNPPSVEVSGMQHWHPDFKLDHLPPIPVAELPELPKVTTTSALQLLFKSTQARNLSPRARSTFQEIVDKASLSSSTSSSSSSSEPSSMSSSSSTTTTTSSLSSSTSSSQVMPSIPSSPAKPATKGSKKTAELLARVRAKEQHRLESLMRGETREQQERSLKISRLPRIIDMIHYFYSTSGRTVMYQENIAAKLAENIHASSDDMKGHLKLLTELVPEWCSLVGVSDGILFKINKDTPAQAVKSKIQKISQRAQ